MKTITSELVIMKMKIKVTLHVSPRCKSSVDVNINFYTCFQNACIKVKAYSHV